MLDIFLWQIRVLLMFSQMLADFCNDVGFLCFLDLEAVAKKVGPDIENLKTPKYHETGQIDFPWLKVYILVARI